MMNEADRLLLSQLRSESQDEDAILLQNYADPEIERSGQGTSMLAMHRQFQAMLAYLLDHDLIEFRHLLRESAELNLSLLTRFDQGEPIDDSYVTLLSYRELFLVLALGDRQMAYEFAARLVAHEEGSRSQTRPIDIAFGMCLCSFVLRVETELERWLDEFANHCKDRGGRMFAGYPDIFLAILRRDTEAVNEGLRRVVKLHFNNCGPNGIFGPEDKYLCLWAIGMVNLARWFGLAAAPQAPLVPEELLVATDLELIG